MHGEGNLDKAIKLFDEKDEKISMISLIQKF